MIMNDTQKVGKSKFCVKEKIQSNSVELPI